MNVFTDKIRITIVCLSDGLDYYFRLVFMMFQLLLSHVFLSFIKDMSAYVLP